MRREELKDRIGYDEARSRDRDDMRYVYQMMNREGVESMME
jgi:hypothetical protein